MQFLPFIDLECSEKMINKTHNQNFYYAKHHIMLKSTPTIIANCYSLLYKETELLTLVLGFTSDSCNN